MWSSQNNIMMPFPTLREKNSSLPIVLCCASVDLTMLQVIQILSPAQSPGYGRT